MHRKTTFLEAPRLSKKLRIDITLATETFQLTGSFKFRPAYHVVSHVPAKQIIAASSGNFGQGIALACSLLNKTCIVVMPDSSAKVKIEAVKELGGQVDLVDLSKKTRAQRVKELSQEFPDAYIASPYDDPLVIEGNATLGEEILSSGKTFDSIVVPVGGGGLSAGIVSAVRKAGRSVKVIGAEPLLGNDAARSFRAGKLLANESEPQTLADGARTVSLGKLNWEILKDGLSDVIEVSEENIRAGLRHYFHYANLKVEPTGCLTLGALLTRPEPFEGKSVCCIVSGGNVDPKLYAELLAG